MPTPLRDPHQIVYLVDDDESLRFMTSLVLEAAGYKTLTFDCAAGFLEKYDGTLRGCLILDVRMPGSDGFALQEAINHRKTTLPIIFLTAYGDIPTSVKGIKAGALDFLTKPTTPGILIPAVENAMAREMEMWTTRLRHQEELGRLLSLDEREREVFLRMMIGLSNKQICEDIGTDAETISASRASVLHKMGVTTTSQLIHQTHQLRVALGKKSFPTVASLFES